MTFPRRGIGQRPPRPIFGQANKQIKRGWWIKGPCPPFCGYNVPRQRQGCLCSSTPADMGPVFKSCGPSPLIHLCEHRLILLLTISAIFLFLKNYLFIFREKGREGEREGEEHQCVVASPTPPPGGLTWPTTQKCALTGNRTSDPLVLRLALNPTEPHQPGLCLFPE